MNKLFFRIGFVVCGLFAMLSCGVSEMKNRLKDVESYIMERPDSALSVLDSMDRTLLTTDRLKAHHALLHAMALDKNYIDVTDDSLASVALDYYSRKGPKKYEARSLYYLGLSYYYAGDYNKAIVELTKSEKIAEKSDSIYLAFAKMLQANIYTATHNDYEALVNFRDAAVIYSRLSLNYYRSVSELSMAKMHFNLGDAHRADSILTNLIVSQEVDKKIKVAAMTDKAFIMTSQTFKDYSNAVSLYESVFRDFSSSYMLAKDYWAYSYALACIGRDEESRSIVSGLSQIDSSGTSYYWRYRIEKTKGNNSEALTMLEKSVNKNDIEVNKALKQSLAVLQRDYFKSQYREYELKVSLKNQMITIIVSLSVLLIFVILHFSLRYMNVQKKEKEKLMEYVEEIKRQLVQAKEEDYPLLKKRFIDLYKSRFETIGTLCEQYLQNKDRTDVEKVMYQKMLLMIEEIRNDSVRKVKFESLLNSELDGIMQNFRNEMPKSKEWEVTMFSYLVAGFDATMISRLMDIPLNNVYAYKRRLKLKIEDKKPEHYVQFLEMIS